MKKKTQNLFFENPPKRILTMCMVYQNKCTCIMNKTQFLNLRAIVLGPRYKQLCCRKQCILCLIHIGDTFAHFISKRQFRFDAIVHYDRHWIRSTPYLAIDRLSH